MEDPNRSATGHPDSPALGSRLHPESLLDADDIQGNVIPGFLKPHMAIAVLTIRDVSAARSWIGSLASQLTTIRQVMPSRHRIRAHRHGIRPPEFAARDAESDEVHDVWFNVSFSFPGLRTLFGGDQQRSTELGQFTDAGFILGLPAAQPCWVIQPAPTRAALRLGRWADRVTTQPTCCWW